MKDAKLYNGDCLEVMDKLIIDGVKVDAIITDPPYGTTACKWDNVIPFDKMWERLKLLRKDKTPVVLFGSEPFSSHLRMSNIKEFKYDWIWEKSRPTGFALCNKQPLKDHELISTFYLKQPKYFNTKLTKLKKPISSYRQGGKGGAVFGNIETKKDLQQEFTNYNRRIIKINNEHNVGKNIHPAQKPIALLQYLIKTYTKENDLILDFTSGSFTTCVASEQLGRRSIGIELEQKYCDIGIKRLNNLQVKFDI
jgi:site-specific DNA-methyltransferase (adenine-specific)